MDNDTLKIGDLVEVSFSNGHIEVGQIKEITNDANFNYVVHITSLNQEDLFNFPHASCDVHCNLKDLKKITKKNYYVIMKSWWEIFPELKIRARRKISLFRYETYEEAQEAVIRIREKDPYYRYNLGDRIYVKKYCE